jgi:hypothetical protein
MIGVLANPSFPVYESQLRDVQEAARALALQVLTIPIERRVAAVPKGAAWGPDRERPAGHRPWYDTRYDPNGGQDRGRAMKRQTTHFTGLCLALIICTTTGTLPLYTEERHGL